MKKVFIIILVLFFITFAFGSGFLISQEIKKTFFPLKEDLNKNNGLNQGEIMVLMIFFNNSNLDPESFCNKVFPVERTVGKTITPARKALELLLAGPTDEEKTNGFFTSINPGIIIQKLTIEDGVAKVDFDEQMEYQMGGSCRVSAIRSEITETLKQFSTVSEVIISVNGRTEDILQP